MESDVFSEFFLIALTQLGVILSRMVLVPPTLDNSSEDLTKQTSPDRLSVR